MTRSQNLNAISNHAISGYNDNKWSAKITISGYVLHFEERDGIAKLVSGPIPSIAAGMDRNKLINAARLLAQELLTKATSAEHS
jgi:hypothetical protein